MKYSGRWHNIGHEVLYASTSIALAALEYAANSAVRPTDSVLMKIEFPDNSLVTIEQGLGGPLPANWPYVEVQTQHLGTEWLVSNDSIALEIPSVIIPQERNLILNPKHAGFASEVHLVETVPFSLIPGFQHWQTRSTNRAKAQANAQEISLVSLALAPVAIHCRQAVAL